MMPGSRTLVALLGGLALSAAAAPDLAEVERGIVRGTNELRASQGLAALEPDAKLAAAAREFAQFSARTERYGHEADGRAPPERATAHGYAYCMVAENIAFQYNSAGFATDDLAQALLRGWRESPGHRRNMLDPAATQTGVAVARSERSGRYYAVQMFGRPAERRIEFSVANRSRTPLRYEVDGKPFGADPGTTVTHTQCSAPKVVLALRGAEPATVQPGDGGRVVVEGTAERQRLRAD